MGLKFSRNFPFLGPLQCVFQELGDQNDDFLKIRLSLVAIEVVLVTILLSFARRSI